MISDEYKFIFIHVPKCAGSSIVEALESYCDNKKYKTGHPNLRQYEQYMSIKEYYIFTFVRNPYDRAVSAFTYLKSGVSKYKSDHITCERYEMKTMTFSEFIKKYMVNKKPLPQHFHPVFDHYIPTGDINKIDYFGKTETINTDILEICKRLNIDITPPMKTNNSKHKHYTEYYDDETRQIVAEKYAKDIEQFGYKFGE
jgi:chondroitin 4-sulfotransferase 11